MVFEILPWWLTAFVIVFAGAGLADKFFPVGAVLLPLRALFVRVYTTVHLVTQCGWAGGPTPWNNINVAKLNPLAQIKSKAVPNLSFGSPYGITGRSWAKPMPAYSSRTEAAYLFVSLHALSIRLQH